MHCMQLLIRTVIAKSYVIASLELEYPNFFTMSAWPRDPDRPSRPVVYDRPFE